MGDLTEYPQEMFFGEMRKKILIHVNVLCSKEKNLIWNHCQYSFTSKVTCVWMEKYNISLANIKDSLVWVRGVVKEEYPVIIMGYFFLFLIKHNYVMGTL